MPLFVVSLGVTLVAAATFARRLDRLGAKFGLSEVSIGLLTAIAADGPEVSSALVALIKGARDASVGVIVGSNMFNLAAMLGVSVLLAGSVLVVRKTLLLEGAAGLLVTAIVIALLLGWVPAAAALVMLACVLVPYLLLVLGGYELACRVGLRRAARLVLDQDTGDAQPDIGDAQPRHARHAIPAEFATHQQLALMVLDIALIVGGSFGMVQTALTLGAKWGLASGIVGALVLGPLTSIPNALTGVRLGRARRGAALVTETLNSNTINLVAGVALPSLFVELTARSSQNRLELALLAAAMVATVGLLAARGGMRRPGAAVIVALYAGFIAATLS
jgi:cation:H+ antiporter